MAPFDDWLTIVSAGERLSAEDVAQLAATPNILQLGMLADTVRRRLHGPRVTYVRVESCPVEAPLTQAASPVAGELRIVGAPDSLDGALRVVAAARAAAGDRAVSGFSWASIDAVSASSGLAVSRVLERLRSAGLDAIAHLPLDRMDSLPQAIDSLAAAGYRDIRLTVDKAVSGARTDLAIRAAELQDQFGCIRVINPLPLALDALRPTTGYDDVKAVAMARLAAQNIPTVQVDWLRYGPKLAQVALTCGADDLDNVTASDDAPDGRRRAPVEEVRRNIEAAGCEPVERDGRFHAVR